MKSKNKTLKRTQHRGDIVSLDEEHFRTIGPEPKDGVKIKKQWYNMIFSYITDMLANGDQITFNDFVEQVHSHFAGQLGANTGWYFYNVKIDMEARGLIEHKRVTARGKHLSVVRRKTKENHEQGESSGIQNRTIMQRSVETSIRIKNINVNSSIKSKFVSLYKTKPLLVHAPGRINLIGEHTDYNSGFVMPAAIDKGVLVALAPSEYDHSLIYSIKYDQFVTVDITAPKRVETPHWANYLLGVLFQLNQRGLPIRNFNCAVDGDLPIGAGLSSSAAIECGFVFALNELFHLDLPKLDMIHIAQWSEHNFAGVQCGIMDQFASIMGKENQVVLLDCRDLTYRYVPLQLGDYSLLLCDTNVKHSLASSEYNTRRGECEEGVRILKGIFPKVHSLREVTMQMLMAAKDKLSDNVLKRCQYVVAENARVVQASEDLQKGRLHEFGKKMFLTHQGLSENYEVSCRELDFLVDKARQFGEVLGSRMMGGGFGGCTINIIHQRAIPGFIKAISKAYRIEFGIELSCHIVKTGNGASVIEKIAAA